MYDNDIDDSELKITELAISHGASIAKKGSLLILVRGSMLFNRVPMGIAAVDVAFNQDVKALTLAPNVDTRFVLYQLLATESKISIDKTGIGAGKIDTDDLKRIVVYIPSIEEQRKVADCLSSVNELIAAEGRKLNALQAHKKALLQQLFPAEGETVPRLRFPEFRDAGEWHSSRLGEVFEISSGGTPDRSNKEYWNGTIPWVTTSLLNNGHITYVEEYISEEGLRNSSAKAFPCGTVLIAMYGQGKTRGKVSILDCEAATNQACAAILPNKKYFRTLSS